MTKILSSRSKIGFIYGLLVLIAAYLTHFRGYDSPQAVFWDENYHVASAYKYLDGIFFMEPHPPLGKLLIALGELIYHPNEAIDLHDFLATDYVKEFPKGFSFTGLRFFPALLSWLTAVMFYLVLLGANINPHIAFVGSFLYIFDNALIVHGRGAMLESPQLFFFTAALASFSFLFYRNGLSVGGALLLGTLSGAAVSVKMNALVLVLLPLFLILSYWLFETRTARSTVWPALKFILCFLLGALTVFSLSWYLHFNIASKPFENRFYRASKNYQAIINSGQSGKLSHFPLMLKEHLAFFTHYERGAPKLDVCKADENGSHPLNWLVGKKSINYRWEKHGSTVQYLYLQANPVIWGLALMGTFLAVMLTISHLFFEVPIKNRRLFSLIALLVILYTAYMGAVLQIDRVLYLYHYFLPLLISFVLAVLIFTYGYEQQVRELNRPTLIALALLALSIVLAFKFYAPLTYYQPITDFDFYRRAWFEFWKLVPVT